ncbi:hypothetical protein CK203_040955 [Vitis vinifera]|uniref:Uncharacterized protein n=1 Tax=Vitis vinifera TaxID=29760 RepID=A0A438HVA6_VITVI|nr:hypothetical protein CK203_040955 [Vitis vinifera]
MSSYNNERNSVLWFNNVAVIHLVFCTAILSFCVGFAPKKDWIHPNFFCFPLLAIGGFIIVEMLFSSSLLAIVGAA